MLISPPWPVLLSPSNYRSAWTSAVRTRWRLSCVHTEQEPGILISLRIGRHQLRSWQSLLFWSKALAESEDLPWPISHRGPQSFPERCSPAPCLCFPRSCPHRFSFSPARQEFRKLAKAIADSLEKGFCPARLPTAGKEAERLRHASVRLMRQVLKSQPSLFRLALIAICVDLLETDEALTPNKAAVPEMPFPPVCMTDK